MNLQAGYSSGHSRGHTIRGSRFAAGVRNHRTRHRRMVYQRHNHRSKRVSIHRFTSEAFAPVSNSAGQFVAFAPGSGNYNADGDNYDFPDVNSYKQSPAGRHS